MKVVDRALSWMLWNRSILFDDPGSHFTYGAFLQETGRMPGALYQFRRTLHLYGLAGLARRPPPGKRELIGMDQTLRRLESVYGALQRTSEARSIARLATTIEEYLAGTSAPSGATRPQDARQNEESFRRRILDRCSENLSNRESLVILAGSEGEEKESERPHLPSYRERLRERDQKMDMEELFSLFGPPEADRFSGGGISGW